MSAELQAVPPHYVVGCVCPNCSSTRTLLNERDGLAAKLAKVRDAALDCFSRGHSKCLSCGEYGEYNAPPHPKKEGCNMEDFQQHRPMLAPETILAILEGDSHE